MISKLFAFILSLSILLLLGCGSNVKKVDSNSQENQTNDNNSKKQANVVISNDSYIFKKSGNKVAELFVADNSVSFEMSSTRYVSELKGDKRKYASSSGAFLAEVKFKDEGFKVRTKDGKLLWKIKIDDDKIKISDNEENKNAYEIKRKDDKIKTKQNEKEIGAAKLKNNVVEITSSTQNYYIEKPSLSYAYGVMVIDEIPDNLKYIIMCEIISKKK